MFSAVSIRREGQRAGVRERVASRPLIAFFALAYLGTWLVLLPLLLAKNGFGILPFQLPAYPFLILASVAGPALSAVLASWAAEGKEGVARLFARYRTNRSRYFWCLLALYGPLLAIIGVCLVESGTGALNPLFEQPLVFVSSYSAFVFTGLPTGPLGEELGWRGFALPRMQKLTNPLWASLGLGVLWAGWHLPLFFISDWKGNAGPLEIGIAFSSWVIPFTVIMTWVYNSAGGNTLISTLMHAGENAAVSLIGLHLLVAPNDLFLQTKVYVVIALILAAATRGQLAVQKYREIEVTSGEASRGDVKRLTPGRIALYLALAAMVAFIAVNLAYDMITGAH